MLLGFAWRAALRGELERERELEGLEVIQPAASVLEYAQTALHKHGKLRVGLGQEMD